jgi:hypothetical protein
MNSLTDSMTTPVCPRCEGAIPNAGWPGMFPGAISRYDNRTEICSDCGLEEAVAEWQGEALVGPTEWPLYKDNRYKRMNV